MESSPETMPIQNKISRPIQNRISRQTGDWVSSGSNKLGSGTSLGGFCGRLLALSLVWLCSIETAEAHSCAALFASQENHPELRVQPSTLDYYNDNAATYNETRAHVSSDFAKQRDAFVALLPKGARILEIGAGHGRDALHFQNLGFDVVATEPSVGLSKIAAEKIGRPVLNVRAQDIGFESEFDAVWAAASLIHIPPSELPAVFARLKAAVKPGGLIHASFLKGVGVDDVPEQIPDGRYFNRASEKLLREVVKSVGGLTVVEDLTRGQDNDYFTALAPTTTFGFFNLYLRLD